MLCSNPMQFENQVSHIAGKCIMGCLEYLQTYSQRQSTPMKLDEYLYQITCLQNTAYLSLTEWINSFSIGIYNDAVDEISIYESVLRGSNPIHISTSFYHNAPQYMAQVQKLMKICYSFHLYFVHYGIRIISIS